MYLLFWQVNHRNSTTINKNWRRHTNSRTDLLLGRKVRGPASRRIEAFSLIVGNFKRSERTHPPSRVCFSINVTFAVGKRRERWKAEESPDRPPPKTAICFGGIIRKPKYVSDINTATFVRAASHRQWFLRVPSLVSAKSFTYKLDTTNLLNLNDLFITTPSCACSSAFVIWYLSTFSVLLCSVDIASACASGSTEPQLYLWESEGNLESCMYHPFHLLIQIHTHTFTVGEFSPAREMGQGIWVNDQIQGLVWSKA